MDWPALFRGALWIAGIGLALAAFSQTRWVAKHAGVPLRTAVSWDSFLAPFFAGLVLFSAGMAWGAERGLGDDRVDCARRHVCLPGHHVRP